MKMIRKKILALCLVLAFTAACTKQEEPAVQASTPAPAEQEVELAEQEVELAELEMNYQPEQDANEEEETAEKTSEQ
jgi:beta-lactam-binding protein with PASTA domain